VQEIDKAVDGIVRVNAKTKSGGEGIGDETNISKGLSGIKRST
jgi:hypothetical protein